MFLEKINPKRKKTQKCRVWDVSQPKIVCFWKQNLYPSGKKVLKRGLQMIHFVNEKSHFIKMCVYWNECNNIIWTLYVAAQETETNLHCYCNHFRTWNVRTEHFQAVKQEKNNTEADQNFIGFYSKSISLTHFWPIFQCYTLWCFQWV